MRRLVVPTSVVVLFLAAAALVAAQESPFLGERTYRALVNEISGDIAFEHIRWFTHYHRPMGGNEGFEAVARYVEEKARSYGLEDVRRISLRNDRSWSPRVGELWLVEPHERRLAYSKEIPLALADFSRNTDVASADLVDVGDGTAEADYEGKAVSGKVVLTSGPPARVMDEAVWKRGALGLVVFPAGPAASERPDQYRWTRIPVENADKTKAGTFAFVLTHRDGMRLRRQLTAAKGAGFKVRAHVESVFHEPATSAIVEAVIRGTDVHDQDIVLTGHLQEEMFSANDDASGCASVLEIARALKKLIDEGRLPRPRRDIRFWWADEISAEEQYFSEHPEERRQFLANINQDMVGAKQSTGSRVQFVTRPPFSRASFLGDVVESIVETLVQGNTSYLAAGQARGLTPGRPAEEDDYSRPVLSRLGTRERYDARVIPFHNNTDHQVFNMAVVGVPGVTFTNWPDPYIHSSDDDLWQMDATQLKRNAVAVAASAYYLASAGEAELPALATFMYGRALERMSRAATTGMSMIAGAPAGDDRAAAYSPAVNLAREAARRERRALESARILAPRASASQQVLDRVLVQLPTDAMAEARMAAFFKALTGQDQVPTIAPSPGRAALALKVPVLVDDVKGFVEKSGKIKRPAALHPLMEYEALNFVNGVRTYFEIYQAVRAEADAAGEWYYGKVTFEDVASVLDSAVEVGVLKLKP
jgi:Zn-dependent M28 family amino/carboxypeptidase